MKYKVLAFFDQAGARAFLPGEVIGNGDLTPEQFTRHLAAGNIAEVQEQKEPTVEAPLETAEAPKAKHKTAKHFFNTTAKRADK
jgi:hypothetical protein